MIDEELRKKIDKYCGSQTTCKECIFGDAVNMECLAYYGTADELKRLKALNRFKKEILGEESLYKDMVKRDNILDKAIEKFGELQLVKASEECCELAQALNKHYCNMLSNYPIINSKTNIIEEIADVEIMIEQVKKILEIKEEDLEEIKNQKLERLERALESVYEKHK